MEPVECNLVKKSSCQKNNNPLVRNMHIINHIAQGLSDSNSPIFLAVD